MFTKFFKIIRKNLNPESNIINLRINSLILKTKFLKILSIPE